MSSNKAKLSAKGSNNMVGVISIMASTKNAAVATLNMAVATKDAALVTKDILPVLAPIFASLKEKKLSKVFKQFRSELINKITISGTMSPKLAPYFVRINSSGVPFANYASDPGQVSQLKKIINALYYIETSLEVIETYPSAIILTNFSAIKAIWNQISPHIEDVMGLLTQPDIDIPGYFAYEMQQIYTLIAKAQAFTDRSTLGVMNGEMMQRIQQAVYTTGRHAGIAVDQLQPSTGQVDVHFLTTFGGYLSSYLSDLTSMIRAYASPTQDKTRTISEGEIKAQLFQSEVVYQSIIKLQRGGILDSLNMRTYLNLGQNLSKLSQSIRSHMLLANEATQAAILHQLTELKRKCLLELFVLIDKMEFHLALNPGVMSAPVMNYLQEWYFLLVANASTVVDIKMLRPDLLVINDFNFLQCRLERMLNQVATIATQQLSLDRARVEGETFFRCVSQRVESVTPIFPTPLAFALEDIQKMLAHYLFVRPYVLQISPFIDYRILRILQSDGSESMISTDLRLFHECEHLKVQVMNKLDKAIESQKFYRVLAEDMMNSIFLHADNMIVPYSFDEEKKPFDLDTEIQRHAGNTVSDKESLPKLIFESCQKYVYRLELAAKACQEVNVLLQKSDWVQYKSVLRNFYLIIQPYLLCCPSDHFEIQAEQRTDRLIIACLQDESKVNHHETLLILQERLSRTLFALSQSIKNAQVIGEKYVVPTQLYLAQQVMKQPIQFDTAYIERIHHLIKHKDYSTTAHRLFEIAKKTLAFFTPPVQSMLVMTQGQGAPYPEIEDDLTLLETCDQVLWIKRLINCIYYVEAYFLSMEALDSSTLQITYQMNVIVAYRNAYYALTLFNTLYHDTDLALMMQDVLQQLKQLQTAWFEIKPLYTSPPVAVATTEKIATNHAVWYPLLDFMVLPAHINALRSARGFSLIEAAPFQKLAHEATLKIEHIIAHSDTYFRMLLASPDMLRVFLLLKSKLTEFAGITYESVILHLESLQNDVISAMLIESDNWELRLGIRPGIISGPLHALLQLFYSGLIEPLSLSSEEHLALIFNLKVFELRKQALGGKLYPAIHVESHRLQASIEILQAFVDACTQPVNASAVFLSCLKKAIPILLENKNRHVMSLTQADRDDEIDALCYQLLPQQTKHLQHIKFLAKRCLSEYKGRKNTQDMQKSMIHAQLVALEKAKKDQMLHNETYKQNYIKQVVEHKIQQMVVQQTDVERLKEPFHRALNQLFSQYQNEIVQSLINEGATDNIEERTVMLLKKPLEEFSETYYGYFMQLESISIALSDFQSYLARERSPLSKHKNIFESKRTLNRKSKCVCKIEEMVKNIVFPITPYSMQVQLEAIREFASGPTVQEHLRDYEPCDGFSFKRLIQIVLHVLNAIGIYTPDYKRQYRALNTALKYEAPPAAECLQCYGLFNMRNRNYELPQPSSMILAL